MGPQFRRTTVMTANGTLQPLQTSPAWQYRTPPGPAILEYTIQSTDANVQFDVFSGSDCLVQRGPVPGGGTAGTFPQFQQAKGSVVVPGGQEIYFTLYEMAAGTPSVMLEIHLTPM